MDASGMTISEFFRLFGRTVVDGRELASADLTEYLALMTYFVSRDATLGKGDLRSRINLRSGSLLATGSAEVAQASAFRCTDVAVRSSFTHRIGQVLWGSASHRDYSPRTLTAEFAA